MKMNAERRREFAEDCREYARRSGITEGVRAELLCLCMEIPEDGVRVVHPGFSGTLLPLVSYSQTEAILVGMYHIGHYNIQNGVLMFVNNDGRTYATCDRAVLAELQQNGYLHDEGLPVFLSNTEILMGNSDLWRQWRNIVAMASI